MNQAFTPVVVEEELQFSLAELCRACRASEDQIRVWVVEGVLEPVGASPPTWRFAGASLRRTRLAMTLTRDLEVNPAGVALALELIDEIEALKARLRRAGGG